jgi:hypothetical protein
MQVSNDKQWAILSQGSKDEASFIQEQGATTKRELVICITIVI